jgi:hypothetical protein
MFLIKAFYPKISKKKRRAERWRDSGRKRKEGRRPNFSHLRCEWLVFTILIYADVLLPQQGTASGPVSGMPASIDVQHAQAHTRSFPLGSQVSGGALINHEHTNCVDRDIHRGLSVLSGLPCRRWM